MGEGEERWVVISLQLRVKFCQIRGHCTLYEQGYGSQRVRSLRKSKWPRVFPCSFRNTCPTNASLNFSPHMS